MGTEQSTTLNLHGSCLINSRPKGVEGREEGRRGKKKEKKNV